ncbi:ABC transporter permease [Saccharibacillus sacchari]|uniref:ABC transporter permease n=1 Tax=Saccharibacillus sacchari TaxID=456493 RepID=UPI0004B4698E|nr:ABC transporter permease [Saccharibacillus sacchari]
MMNFLKLVHNENIKIYIRKRTWILLGILIVLAIGIPSFIAAQGGGDMGVWGGVGILMYFNFLPIIFSAVIAAESVASEFTGGTIKLLLIRPWSRIKILASKFIAVLLFLLAVSVAFFGIGLLVSYVLLGTGVAGSAPTAIQAQGIWLSVIYTMVDGLLYTTIAFAISAVFRSSMLALALTVIFEFMGSVVTSLVSPEKYAIGKYLLFVNMDLDQYTGSPLGRYGVTSLSFSLTVLAVYFVAFLFIAAYVFRKRDVAG